MHIKNLKQYYFIDKFDYSHLINLNKNISFIWRNKDKEPSLKNLMELRNFCKKNQRKFYINNKIKLANKINADGLYISSSNRNLIIKSSTSSLLFSGLNRIKRWTKSRYSLKSPCKRCGR